MGAMVLPDEVELTDLLALTELPRTFSPKALCPKCESKWTRVQHCTGEPGDCQSTWWRFPVLLADHFHRWCEECSHLWVEAPAGMTIESVLPRCEQCYGQENPTDAAVGFVLACVDCGTLLCEPCTAEGCVGCAQITDAVEVLNDKGLYNPAASAPSIWAGRPTGELPPEGDWQAGDAGGNATGDNASGEPGPDIDGEPGAGELEGADYSGGSSGGESPELGDDPKWAGGSEPVLRTAPSQDIIRAFSRQAP